MHQARTIFFSNLESLEKGEFDDRNIFEKKVIFINL